MVQVKKSVRAVVMARPATSSGKSASITTATSARLDARRVAASLALNAVKFQKAASTSSHGRRAGQAAREPVRRYQRRPEARPSNSADQYQHIRSLLPREERRLVASCWDEASVDFMEQFAPPATNRFGEP